MSIWQFLKDPPNSVAILVSVAWPLGVWFLARRRVQGVPNLEVMAKPGATHIGERPYDAIEFTFQNLTGQIVYISKVQLRENAETLPIYQGGHDERIGRIERERLVVKKTPPGCYPGGV